jgi:hypothetical protein
VRLAASGMATLIAGGGAESPECGRGDWPDIIRVPE